MDGYRRNRLLVSHAAKLFIVDRRENCRRLPANGTSRIASQVELTKFDFERVEVKQASNQWFTDAENQLDRLDRLQHADDSGQHAQHACLRAVRNRLRWRRFRKKAAITWPAQVWREHGRLSFETKYRAVYIWLLSENTDVVG